MVRKSDHNGAYPRDPDADCLGVAWNEITAGQVPSYEDGPTEVIAAAELLHAEAPAATPRPRFKTDLREKLMNTAMPVPMLAMAPLKRLHGGSITVPPSHGGQARPPLTLPKAATRWMAIAATIALLLTTAVGAYLGGLGRSNNEPRGTNIAAPFAGTPESSDIPPGASCTEAFGPYVPCYVPLSHVGKGLIASGNLPSEALAARSVQMQGWELDSGERVQFGPPANPLAGVGVDIVVGGAYQATFSAPATVAKSIIPGRESVFEYPDANTPIELSTGDSVTYLLGSKQDLANPLENTTLQFKSILIYEGDATPENVVTSGSYRSRLDGGEEVQLPMRLGDFDFASGIYVTLTYVELWEMAFPFPPDDTQFSTYLLGPVASTLAGGGPDEGFVVWLITGQG